MPDPRESAIIDARSYITKWVIFIIALSLVFSLSALAIYCANLPANKLIAFGAALMVALASYLAGGLFGFLFGIPRAQAAGIKQNSGTQRGRLTPNTNLEDVSDWLTKIIVGATLVQIGSLARRFGDLATFVSSIFGGASEQNKVMAGGIILFFAVFGFFANYVIARSLLTFMFYISPSDWIPERQELQNEQNPSNAEEPQTEFPN